jgi:signal transduction histidine kinase
VGSANGVAGRRPVCPTEVLVLDMIFSLERVYGYRSSNVVAGLPAPIEALTLTPPGTSPESLGGRLLSMAGVRADTCWVGSRWVVAVTVVACTGLAVMASWLFGWPQQEELAQLLGVRVGRPLEPYVVLSWVMTGAVLTWVRPRNAVGWLLLVVGGFQVLQNFAAAYGSLGVYLAAGWPAARWAALLGSVLWLPGLLPLANVLPAIYPDGRVPGPRWRVPLAASSAGIVMVTVMAFFSNDAYQDVAPGPSPLARMTVSPAWLAGLYGVVAVLLLVGGTVTIWVMSAVRLARLARPRRQQLAWVLVVVVAMFVLALAPLPGWLFSVSTPSVPVAIAVGIFRYDLLGMKAVLRRTLVYAALTTLLFGAYLLLTSLAGSGLGQRAVPGFVAAALVAVGLAPLRERLQRAVDRFVYGESRDPLRAVSRLGGHIASSKEPDLVAGVLSNIAAALHAPGATLSSPEGHVLAATGVTGEGLGVPLSLGGKSLGSLIMTARSLDERYGPADRRLLDLLAPQLAVMVHALDLTEELQTERDAVVEATGAERTRLRQELHDGLGPSLTGMGLGLVALEDALAVEDLATSRRLVSRMRGEVGDAVSEVRRIIDGLSPLGLDELGLNPAIHRLVGAAGIPVHLALEHLPHLRPDVEIAAYRIAAEALTNVAKHAHATHTTLDLRACNGVLSVEVADDGRGFIVAPDGMAGSGVGLASMRHRATTVGGELDVLSGTQGTTVTARLPLVPR